jgi:hypothetical protein
MNPEKTVTRTAICSFLCTALQWVIIAQVALARDYFISSTGNDASAGTASQPWQTIQKVNAVDLEAGDCVYFEGGKRFVGTIELGPDDTGALDKKLVLASYGQGQAVIDGANGSSLKANGCSHLALKNLHFVGSGRKTGNTEDGVYLLDCQDVEIDHIEVSSFRTSGLRLDGVRDGHVSYVSAHDNGFAGISVGHTKRSANLRIDHCTAKDNPGDPSNLDNHSGNGILVANAENVVVEYCEAANNGWDMPRKGNGPVGIWMWNSDRVIIQFCISHDNKSPGDDGGGFDIDGGATDCVLQYNLSYNNDGPGYFLCQFPGAPDFKDNVIRYNISYNDGVKNNRRSGIDVFSAGANASRCQVYNNTVYNRNGPAVGFGGLPMPDVMFRNNIFVCSRQVTGGDGQRGRFENNTCWAADGSALPSEDQTVGKYVDPKLILPSAGLPTDPNKLAELTAFKLQPGSPCLDAGVVIKDNGGRDFWGHPVPADSKPTIGACEKPRKERS